MTEYLTIIPELLLSLLHLLIIRKYMKVFWGPANENLKSYIEWGIYYVFLIINNINSIFPPHLLLFGADIYDQLSYSQEEYQTALYIFLIDMCSMDVSGSYRHDDTNVYGF